MHQHMDTGGTVCIQLDDVVGLHCPLLVLYVVVDESLFSRRHLVRLIADHFSDGCRRDADIFSDARLAKVLGYMLANRSRGKGEDINLYEQCIFTGVCELRADLQQVYL